MDPKGKVVVVTGATSGLGRAFAIDAARAGAKVFIIGRDAARANETLALARTDGGDADVVVGDVSTREGVKAVAASVLAKTSRVDVLVNNAGGSFKTESKTSDAIDSTFAVNTLGPFLLERELSRRWRSCSRGRSSGRAGWPARSKRPCAASGWRVSEMSPAARMW